MIDQIANILFFDTLEMNDAVDYDNDIIIIICVINNKDFFEIYILLLYIWLVEES